MKTVLSLSLWKDRSASVALEFAIVGGIMIMLGVGSCILGLFFWQYDALESVVADSARCIAIGSANCATVTAGCDSAVPGICYAEQSAANRGIPDLTASQVTINPTASYSGATFTGVTINRPISFFDATLNISATGVFPH